nr:tripartite tricarboxylate transporter substrate-binding protein [Bradyrhizobium campsiandrae]
MLWMFMAHNSYVHVRGVSSANQILVATAAAPYSTLAEFVAYAKANPGKINFGSPAPAPLNTLPARCSRRPPASS